MSPGCSQLVDSTAVLPAQWPTYLPSHPAQGWICKSSLLLLDTTTTTPLATTTRPNVRVLSIHPPIHACTIHAHTNEKSKDDSRRKKQRWGSTLLACLGACKESWKDFFLFFLFPSLISGGNDSFFRFARCFALCSLLFALLSR